MIGTRAESMTVGAMIIAGDYAIRTATKFGSGTSAHTATSWIGLLFALGGIQTEHVQQNCGHVRHHNEWNEHDEPWENGEPANAQLI